MKVLIIHTCYQKKGGEDNVFEQEAINLMSKAEVKSLTFFNYSGLKGAIQFLGSIFNFFAAHKIKNEIQKFKPDVIHVHNIHFAIGPAVIWAAKKSRVPIVHTIHNYRLLCPSATLYFNGKLYLQSLSGGFPWMAVKNKVYRDSIIQTFWSAFVIYFHKKIGTWKKIDKYIVLTPFAKKLLIDSDLKIVDEQIEIKANFVEDRGYNLEDRNSDFLYVGRLSEEKGLKVLIGAFDTQNILYIMGDGPLKVWLEQKCTTYSNIRYLGRKSSSEIIEAMKICSALIFPSIWYEGMPLTLIEAFSCGTPVIASELGAMKDMIQQDFNGLLFNPGNAEDLKTKIRQWMSKSPQEKKMISINARTFYEKRYSVSKNIEQLVKIYKQTLHK